MAGDTSGSEPEPSRVQGEATQPGDGPATDHEGDPPTQAGASQSADDDRPDLEQLREELNDQFESIRIVEPGQYELNLMELYDRQEYIISLQEDGRYVIEVPDRWNDDE